MANDKGNNCYKGFWITWAVLLVLSAGMLALGGADVSRTIKVPLLVVGMLWMAWLIASRFMHLKDEKTTLVITVVGTTLFCAVALFVLIAPDGTTALHRLVQ